jgi:phosphatidyl-myo-inositol dimannoside synthase
LKILILPPSDYLGHPNPCRLHHIFEQFPDFGDEIYVMRFPLRDKIVRKSNATVFSMHDTKFKAPSMYYLLNSGVFAKSVADVIKKYGIDSIVYANLLPPFLASKIVPKNVFSIVDLVDCYPAVAVENTPKAIPRQFVNLVYSRMMKSVLTGCDCAVACSYMLADYAKQNGARDVYRIPNGVEEYFFMNYKKEAISIRQKFGIKDSDIVICFVGNLEYWLDMKELLEALHLVKKNITKGVKFLIVGGKLSSNYAHEVESQIRALKLEENVINVGFIVHDDVPKYIAASDICVSPKNIHDPVSFYSAPVKVWEYLAQGKPVISTPIPEILLGAKDCVSIANTSLEYYSCIESFIDDPTSFTEKAKRGQVLARKQTWRKIAVQYHDLLSILT